MRLLTCNRLWPSSFSKTFVLRTASYTRNHNIYVALMTPRYEKARPSNNFHISTDLNCLHGGARPCSLHIQRTARFPDQRRCPGPNIDRRSMYRLQLSGLFHASRNRPLAKLFSTAGSTLKQLPLEGITVVSLEQAIAAPFCTRQLADLGARVIKIERPVVGDFARQYDKRVKGQSSHFVWTNRSKESLALDLKQPKDLGVVKALLSRADVLVQNLAPGATGRLGLSYEALRERYPSLIVCDISGYGSDGPYRDKKAYDLLVQSEAGVLSITGTKDEPAKVGMSIADISAGMYAFTNIMGAIMTRTKTGKGTNIDSECPFLHVTGHQPASLMTLQLDHLGLRHAILTLSSIYVRKYDRVDELSSLLYVSEPTTAEASRSRTRNNLPVRTFYGRRWGVRHVGFAK